MLLILLILIFIRPFISSLAFPYVNYIYSLLLLGFLASWIIIKGVHFNEIKSIRWPIALFILALLISLTFSQNTITSLNELYKYITGISLLLVTASLAHRYRERIILWIIIAGFLISLLAIYQYFFGFQRLLSYILKEGVSEPFILDYVSRKRVFLPFVTPNILSGYLAMIIPLALIRKHGAWLIISLSSALLLTGSLGGFISLFFGLVIYFYLKGKLRKRNLIFLFVILIIIGLVFIARAATQKQHLQPFFSAVMRLNYWQDSLSIIKAHPLTGVGLGNFNLIRSRYAHNSYLQLWAEMGILGVICIIWLIIRVLKFGLHNINSSPYKNQIAGLITAGIVFSIHNFIDFSFFLPEVSLIWWVILGITLSKRKSEYNNSHSDL